ncbi:hypothetical protein [Paenibacillus odorifer]|uniref:hypothetical protein n=1 Tax=Paenibacillus odorifer TaxID=189426 RepID=UPI0015C2D677|nr:hypothetical protein [Paenibacillus odorifer]
MELWLGPLPPCAPTNDISSYHLSFKDRKRIATFNLFALDGTASRVSIVGSVLKTTLTTTENQSSDNGFRGWNAVGAGNTPSSSRTAFHFVADTEL